MRNIALIIATMTLLSGCLPALFTAGATTTIVAAKDRTIGETAEDIKIANKLRKEFATHNFHQLLTKIDIEVMKGRVMLTGLVTKDEDMVMAVELAWKIDGVKEVINEITVDENSSYFDAAQYSRDSWITGRIKAATIFAREIKFVNYTVITVKGVVYLFGLAKSQEELEKVSSIAAEVKGVKRVVSHVRVEATN